MNLDGSKASCDAVGGERHAGCDGASAVEILLVNRRFLYLYSARAFSMEPNDDFLGIVCDPETMEECSLLDGESGSGGVLQGAIAEGVRSEQVADTLKSEYTRLFIGPGSLPVPPWESVFVSHDALLFQESTLDVREAYRACGFRAAGYPHEPDDHLSTELDFMAALCDRACEAMLAEDESALTEALLAQQAFLQDHLLVWIREFSDRLNEVDGISSFYPSFASLAALVCERDAEVIKELLAAA